MFRTATWKQIRAVRVSQIGEKEARGTVTVCKTADDAPWSVAPKDRRWRSTEKT